MYIAKMNIMKNILYIFLGVAFLGLISGGASSFLTTETSSTLDNLYTETFYIDPETIEESENILSIILLQNNSKNAYKKVSDCIDFYKQEFNQREINCTLVVKKNVALSETCDSMVGKFIREEDIEILNFTNNTKC
jgi:hypothetical protein